ncbi:hypothetical protein HNQ07_001971 [Deinococcus metalli]|uniref:RNA polymerase sigma-70 region 2 domain-containing protein n=1 Tax=Deinococcus metalli TaxID=1141878 RepID=A0A7W8NRV5_9DEIO|nr:hypothetical protein [Deinococcus metalli]MBB5376507.1 hypothetical protein [Deinococcus metalli]GHF43514.1 hypothetical protein GCM10017781_19940 [Deinococcus metalli]
MPAQNANRPHHDPCAAVLDQLASGGGRDLRPCIQMYGGLLLTLAHRYAFPDPEEALYLAFLDVRAGCSSWPSSHLSARTWVLGIGKRCYDRLALVPADVGGR